MNLHQIHKYIEQAADEAQRLLDVEFAKCNNQPSPGSALDQAGLRDGKEIVVDYLSHGEPAAPIQMRGPALETSRRRELLRAAPARWKLGGAFCCGDASGFEGFML